MGNRTSANNRTKYEKLLFEESDINWIRTKVELVKYVRYFNCNFSLTFALFMIRKKIPEHMQTDHST